MRRFHRQIAALIFSVVCMALAALPAMADSSDTSSDEITSSDLGRLQEQQRILLYDQADLLTDTEENELLYQEAELEVQTGWAVRVCAIDDADGKDAETWMDDYSDSHYVQEDVLGLLIDMDNREIRILTGGAVVYYIDDERIDTILDDAYPYVSGQEYYDAFETMLSDVAEYYRQGLGSDWTINPDTGEITTYAGLHRITRTDLLLAVILASVVGVGFASVTAGKYRMKIGRYRFDAANNTHLNLTQREDRLVNRFVTQRHIPRNPPPDAGGHGGGDGGHGGGSTVHTSSGGHSYGGGGRSF